MANRIKKKKSRLHMFPGKKVWQIERVTDRQTAISKIRRQVFLPWLHEHIDALGSSQFIGTIVALTESRKLCAAKEGCIAR